MSAMPITAATIIPFALDISRGPQGAAPPPALRRKAAKWIAENFIRQLNDIQSPANAIILPFQQFYCGATSFSDIPYYRGIRRIILIGGKTSGEPDAAFYAHMINCESDGFATYHKITELPITDTEETSGELAHILAKSGRPQDGTILVSPLPLPDGMKATRIVTDPSPYLPIYEILPFQLHKTLR